MTTAIANPDFSIDLRDVAKTYKGKVKALRGIDMRVHRGEVFGLLGPNGAGKSTLVKILLTVIRPTACRGTMLGRPVGHKPTLARVGYLPEHHRFPEYLTGRQVVDLYGTLAGATRRERRRKGDELLDTVGMGKWADKKVKGYSKGMRQRVGIAQALVNDPELVVLDEPTDGVDPVGRRDIREIVTQMRDQGRTVFINSHLLSELEMVCTRVSILVQGLVAQQGTIDELTVHQQRYEIELTEELPGDAAGVLRKLLPSELTDETSLAERVGISGELATGQLFAIERNRIRIGTTDPEHIQPVLGELVRRGAMIKSVRAVRPSLEDLFMQAVQDPETGKPREPGAGA